MTKEKRLVHLSVLDGQPEEMQQLRNALCLMKDEGKIAEEYEFLITNDRVTSRDAKWLINELYTLFKRDREIKENVINKTVPANN